MLEINWLRMGVMIVACLATAIVWGNSQLARRFADDLVLALTRAHLGKLPKGQYCGQYVYTKHMTREQLCVPLDAEQLAEMAACTEVMRHEAHFEVMSCKAGAKRCTVALKAAIAFEGRKPDGTPVTVQVKDAALQAEIERNKDKGWMLTSLTC